MQNIKYKKIFVDTTFCIRLMKPDDILHNNARQYYDYFLRNDVELYLSSIVVGEYAVKADPTLLPLNSFKILPFNFFDGHTAGDFHAISKSNEVSFDRIVIKDDCKLLAQLANNEIIAFLSTDKKIERTVKNIQNQRAFNFQLIDFSIPLADYIGELVFPD